MASIGFTDPPSPSPCRSPLDLDRDGYPCKRFKSDGFTDKLVPPPPPPPPSPSPSPCGSQEQTPPIYRGPGAGKGLIYDTIEGKDGNDTFEHTIFFKGDRFTVREDMTLKITEKKKLKGPPLDNRIRNVWDPEYKDFLECLKNKRCPTVFSKERGGLHIIRLFGLHDDEDLEVPDIPYDCDTWVDIDDLWM